MVKQLLAAAAIAAFTASGAYAEDKKEPTARQNRMAQCNKGAERSGAPPA